MNERRQILAQILIEVPSTNAMSLEATQAALRSSIQLGLNAQVLEIKLFQLASTVAASSPSAAPSPSVTPPKSSPSDSDQVIEEYTHFGMIVRIYRDAGRRSLPTYFATVMNPAVKNPTGSVLTAKSYADLKKTAEARAERKDLLWRKRLQLE